MRLIDTFTFEIYEFSRSPPPYATLSYVIDGSESSFRECAKTHQDPIDDNYTRTITRACGRAQNAGLRWLWHFRACVDQNSAAAQSEAINSLAEIYRNCEHIIIYLGDLDSKVVGDGTILERLSECRWIRNIWAIPEIVFARLAYFYSCDWEKIGTKGSLSACLSSIMGIDEPVLEDSDRLHEYPLARRMSWASAMTAMRIEDLAYALLGLFNVSMAVLYGEGQKAFLKLQEEIMKDTDDFSLLAWDSIDTQEHNRLFANSPACFGRFRERPITPLRINGEVQIHCKGIIMQTSFWKTESGLFLPLKGQDGSTCFVPLIQWDDSFLRNGNRVYWDLPEPMAPESRRICIKRDPSTCVSNKTSAFQGGNAWYRVGSLLELHGKGNIARDSRCSVVEYKSKDDNSSMETFVDNLTFRYTPSASLCEFASYEDTMAWSAYDTHSMEGASSPLNSDVTQLWLHDTTSETACDPLDGLGSAEGRFGSDLASNYLARNEIEEAPRHSIDENEALSAKYLDVALVAKQCADVAVEEFLSSNQRQSRKRSFLPWQNQDRKRPKLLQSSGQLEVVHTSDSDDGETVMVNKIKYFACPFYVRNKKYAKCITRHHLQRIEDVKEHVCWEHRQPIFCPMCKEEFSSSRDRDAHIRLRICRNESASSTPEGVSDAQEEELEKEASYLSEESRWFQIWDIIFPDVEPPTSAFYTEKREVNVSAFRHFWTQSGEMIVANFLEKNDCQSYRIENEERKLRAIYDLVLENVVDKMYCDLGDVKVDPGALF